MILSAKTGCNDDVFKDVAALYILPNSKVADVTYGSGIFWKQVDTTQFEFFPSDLKDGIDLRQLPYVDNFLDVLVMDPPYIYNPKATVKASLADCYNVNQAGLKNTKEVLELYYAGIVEAYRVLKPKGRLIVKCQDTVEASKQKLLHVNICIDAAALGFVPEDLFVLVQKTQPTIRWKVQKHARKNHSYFLVFTKHASA